MKRLLLALFAASALAAHAQETKPRRASPEAGTLQQDEREAAPAVRIIRTPARPTEPAARRAWSLLAAGRLDEAQREYERVLQADPRNADALHGLAHLAAFQSNASLARAYLTRALEANPRDAHAAAALASLAAPDTATESQLKSLIASQPEAAAPRAALGVLLARRARWAEAQEAFARAWSLDPSNPDLQYNLALCLEHLRKPEAARQHYAGALAAADKRAAGFEPARVRARLEALPGGAQP